MSSGHKSSDAASRAKPAEREPASDITPSAAPAALALGEMGNQARQRFLRAHGLLTKLRVSPSDDPLERDADRVADEVLRKGPREEELNKPLAPPLPPRGRLLPRLGAGDALDASSRAFFEPRFGYDLSSVRVHADPLAAAAALALDARAFAYGNDIFFEQGAYAPGSAAGRQLIAHELTHVVQQSTLSTAMVQRQGHGRETPQTYNVRMEIPFYPPARMEGLTEEEALRLLGRVHRHLSGLLQNGVETHADLRRLLSRQWIVGTIANALGGVSLPEDAIWAPVRVGLNSAREALDAGQVLGAARALQRVADAWRRADRALRDYREGSISGAETSVTVLEVTAVAGAIAATVATGGAAAAAGSGLLGTSAAVGVVGGAYGATQELATEAGEVGAGMRREFDIAAILRRGAVDAAANFVGAIAGGVLARYATRFFGSYLSNIGDDVLAELGEQMGMRGPLPRDFFLTGGQRFIAEFLGGIGSSPLTTAVSIVLNGITGGGEIPGPREFTRQVIEEMVRGGALQLFIGAVTHGRIGGGRGGRRGGGAASETATPRVEVPEATARPTEPAPAPPVEVAAVPPVEAAAAPPVEAAAAPLPAEVAPTPPVEAAPVAPVEPVRPPRPPRPPRRPRDRPYRPRSREPATYTATGSRVTRQPVSRPEVTRVRRPLRPRPEPVVEEAPGARRYREAPESMLDPESRRILPDFDRNVAESGAIESIRARHLRSEGGRSLSVTVSGEVLPDTTSRTPRPGRATAPGFNVRLRRLLELSSRLRAIGLNPDDWHIMHLWGPGFGGEAAAGMMVGPREVNVGLQSRRYIDAGTVRSEGVEVFIREVARQARARGGSTQLTATAVAWPDPTPRGFRAPAGQPFLRSLQYRIEVRMPGARPASMRVNITVAEPPSTSAQLDIDPGSIGYLADFLAL